ncbi:MAG: hypothetical protein IPK93_07275 [Solirubrobacterales bacterium]|nr:hypothetical protein [Solirubrobacterales bacterium]
MNHHSELLNVRRIAVVAFAIFMALAFTASVAANSADAKKKHKKAKVSLAVKTKNQASLLKGKKLKVKVRSSAKTKVRLKVVSGGRSNRFKVKKVKFSHRGKKTVKVSLSKKGKSALAKCGSQTVKVVGKYKKGKKKAKASKKKRLAKQSSRCVDPLPPIGPGTKSTCDPLDPTVCMQPWPSDFYTKAADTKTGRQLDIPVDAMPKNASGKSITLPDTNRADGFSPGNLVVAKVPEVETPAAFNNSGIVSLDDVASYEDANAPVMVLDADSGVRQPIYAELDANPTTKSTVELTVGQPPVEITGGHPNDDPRIPRTST